MSNWKSILKTRENMSPEDKVGDKIEGLKITYEKYKPHIEALANVMPDWYESEYFNWAEEYQKIEDVLQGNDLSTAIQVLSRFSKQVDDAFQTLTDLRDHKALETINQGHPLTGFVFEIGQIVKLHRMNPDY